MGSRREASDGTNEPVSTILTGGTKRIDNNSHSHADFPTSHMIICNCNALNERQVNAAISSGISGWREVHDYHGHEPSCGQCRCEISELISLFRRDSIEPSSASIQNKDLEKGGGPDTKTLLPV